MGLNIVDFYSYFMCTAETNNISFKCAMFNDLNLYLLLRVLLSFWGPERNPFHMNLYYALILAHFYAYLQVARIQLKREDMLK